MCVRGLPPPGRALPRGPCAPWAPQARYEPAPSAPRRRPAARERPARPQAGAPDSGPAEGEGVPARPPRRARPSPGRRGTWLGRAQTPPRPPLGGISLGDPRAPNGRRVFPSTGHEARLARPGVVPELRGSARRAIGVRASPPCPRGGPGASRGRVLGAHTRGLVDLHDGPATQGRARGHCPSPTPGLRTGDRSLEDAPGPSSPRRPRSRVWVSETLLLSLGHAQSRAGHCVECFTSVTQFTLPGSWVRVPALWKTRVNK